MSLIEGLEKARIIPLITLNDAEDIIPVCEALQNGGLKVAEVTFRTSAAEDAIRLARKHFPDFIVGAGTVTTIGEVEQCKSAGAQFAIAPGLNPPVVQHAQELDLPFFPGVCTPTEVETALELGCTVLKFFPTIAMGGAAMLKSVYRPYQHRGVRFIPTGGITEEDFADYLALPFVVAVCGSWLTDKTLIEEKNWKKITDLTHQALTIASKV